MNALLHILGEGDELLQPPYGSFILIELHDIAGEMIVKVWNYLNI
jgi:hypothetical protein